jgi:hypothetical protein
MEERNRNAAQDQEHEDRRNHRGGPEDPLENQLLGGVPRVNDRHGVGFALSVWLSKDGRAL